jgi:Fanconi anemia group D2 protein
VVGALLDLKENSPTLLLPILDAVSSLRISSESLRSVTEQTLSAIEAAEPSALPAIIRFLLQHTQPESATKIIKELRLRLKLPDATDSDNITAATLTLEALVSGFLYRSDLTQELSKILSESYDVSDHGAADIWLLLCCNHQHNKKSVVSVVRKKAVNGTLSRVLVEDAIKGYAKQIETLCPSALSLADALLRATEHASRVLGGAFYIELFNEFTDLTRRQDVIAQLTTHVGSGNASEVDEALLTLQILTRNHQAALKPFAPFLFSLLDSLTSLTASQVRRLFVVLFTIHEDNDGDNIHIVIRKYLSHSSLPMKQIGVIGATAFVVTKSSKLRRDNMVVGAHGEGDDDETDLEPQLALQADQEAFNEVNEVLSLARTACESSASSAGFLYDELALAIKGNQISPRIRDVIQDSYSVLLEDHFVGDPATGTTVELPLLNAENIQAEMRYNIDDDVEESSKIYIKILDYVYRGNAKIATLVPLIRLISACSDPRFGGDGLAELDAVIGCPMMLPSEGTSYDFQIKLDEKTKLIATASTFHATNWVRELLNAYVHDAAFPHYTITHPPIEDKIALADIRDKIVQRLNTLIDLEDDLFHMASNCVSFAPPNCPSLESAGFSSGAAEGMDLDDDEVEGDFVVPDPPDTEDMTKEEKKEALKEYRQMVSGRKKAHKKKQQAQLQGEKASKHMEAKRSAFLKSRCQDALRSLSPHVVLALGFPMLAAIDSGNQSQAVNASQQQLFGMEKVGNAVTELLFKKLYSSLEEKVEAKANVFGIKRKSEMKESCETDEGNNPYADNREHQEASKLVKLLDLYVEGGVFTAVYEHTVMMLEVGDDCSDTPDWKQRILSCLTAIMSTVNLLMTTEVLSSGGSSDTAQMFSRLLGQLSSGDPKGKRVDGQSGGKSVLETTKQLEKLYSLIEEIAAFPKLTDVSSRERERKLAGRCV